MVAVDISNLVLDIHKVLHLKGHAVYGVDEVDSLQEIQIQCLNVEPNVHMTVKTTRVNLADGFQCDGAVVIVASVFHI